MKKAFSSQRIQYGVKMRFEYLTIFSLVLATLMPLNKAEALMFCSRPSEPYIPSAFGAGVYSMQSAEQDVQFYLDEMSSYLDCLADEMNDARYEAERVLDEWNATVRQFNSQ